VRALAGERLRGIAMNNEARIDEFEAVALPHLDTLFRTATRILRDRSDAGDVVQETYLQAWKSFHRFEAGTNCRAWLFKILFHTIHHHRRKAFRAQLRLVRDDEPGLEETLAAEPPVNEDLDDATVLAAFDRMPDYYREVVLLVDVQEFSYKEASEALGVPIGTVMSRLSRGRKLLREELVDYAQSFGIGSRTLACQQVGAGVE
jgi:RNA polymerase sigma-70 factor, ECF subfamily